MPRARRTSTSSTQVQTITTREYTLHRLIRAGGKKMPWGEMRIGQIGLIDTADSSNTMHRSYHGQCVIRVYGKLVSLDKPGVSWGESGTSKMTVRLAMPTDALTIITHPPEEED
jgi:hypothetical protein